MKQKIRISILVLVTGCAAWFFMVRLLSDEKTSPRLHPDAIATSTAENGKLRIENKSAGYVVTIPQDWYLEKSAGSGVTLYPHYAGTNEKTPACKVEISALQNAARKDLVDWLVAYLHSDPTASVVETSRMVKTVDGATAIFWSGTLNDIETTLAYVATGTIVYEIAPSVVLEKNSASLGVECADVLSDILKNFQFTR
jgi:hypothetical protein